MAAVKALWKKSKVSNKRKLNLYRSLVKTVLTYIFGTWGLTNKKTEIFNKYSPQAAKKDTIKLSMFNK